MPDLDDLTLMALRDNGADLAKPRETVHHLYFPDRPAAERAAGRLRRESRKIELRQMKREWMVRVTQVAVVGPSTIAGLREEFERAAAAEGGDYDGWEAALD